MFVIYLVGSVYLLVAFFVAAFSRSPTFENEKGEATKPPWWYQPLRVVVVLLWPYFLVFGILFVAVTMLLGKTTFRLPKKEPSK